MAGLHWEGAASCPPIKNVPTTNIKHLTLIMGGQDATLSPVQVLLKNGQAGCHALPSACLLKTWAGRKPRSPQCNLAKNMGG